MSKKMKILNLVVLILFLCSVTGCVVTFFAKPKLYYPAVTLENIPVDYDYYKKFDKDFKMIRAMDLLPNGNCSAGKNDFVILEHDDAVVPIAKNIAAQGARVLLLHERPGYYRSNYSGDIYYQGAQEIESNRIDGDTLAEVSHKLRLQAGKTARFFFSIASFVMFLLLLIMFVLTMLSKANAFGSRKEGNIGALIQLSHLKYRISLVSVVLMLILNCAWLFVPSIYMFSEGYSGKFEIIASLISLPFLACAFFGLLNLTRMKNYRRWVNIVCLTFTAIALGIILFSLIMLLFN
ncbi:MAG TPA: hypothetical protein GXZ76_05800 [Clostridiaceae bacterium]|nr:hypothetical protein [Clostridiaceae bacterium]